MPYINHYAARFALAEWLKKGRADMYTNVSLTADKLKELGLELGQFVEVENRIFRAVRARSAFTAKGYTGKTYMGAAGRTGTAAVSTKDELITADTFVKGDLDGGQVWASSGTDFGSRRIRKNGDTAAASTVRVAPKLIHSLRTSGADSAEAFTVAPDATSVYNIHCGWEVAQTTAVTDLVTCVSLGAVADGHLTIVEVEAEYSDIFCAGNTDALTVGGLIVPSSATGVSKGQTTAGLTAGEAARWFAQSYDAYTGAGGLRKCRLMAGKHNVGGLRIQTVN